MGHLLAILMGLSLFVTVTVLPSSAQELERGARGTLACGGNHDIRLGGTEVTFTGYTFRNFNSSTTITIDDITIYDSTGVVLRSMPAPDPFPAGFNNILGPHETTNFDTTDLFGLSGSGVPANRPLQAILNWTASRGGFDLFGHMARMDRERIPGSPPSQGESRARGLLRCVTLRGVSR